MRVCLDFDGVIYGEDDYIPGAVAAVKRLRRRGHQVYVHSCRSLWPEGRAFMEQRLAGLGVEIHDLKPDADVYVDDRGIRFDGDWPALMHGPVLR